MVDKAHRRKLQATVPLYISNYCDSNCKVCNMRHSNSELKRVDGTKQEIQEQLKIIYEIEKISSVLLLSGEYKKGAYRENHIERMRWSINKAFEIGFEQVSINIGALNEKEIAYLYENCNNQEHIILSVFQETYDKVVYQKTFGESQLDIPKSNYHKRLITPELWLKGGFKHINLGILLGLNDSKYDVEKLIEHATSLHEQYMCQVHISLPRIILNGRRTSISDEEFLDIVKQIKNKLPWAKIIITTREDMQTIEKLIPHIDIISPGSSDILAYSKMGPLTNRLETSQFFVSLNRERPSDVLRQLSEICAVDFEFFSGGT